MQAEVGKVCRTDSRVRPHVLDCPRGRCRLCLKRRSQVRALGFTHRVPEGHGRGDESWISPLGFIFMIIINDNNMLQKKVPGNINFAKDIDTDAVSVYRNTHEREKTDDDHPCLVVAPDKTMRRGGVVVVVLDLRGSIPAAGLLGRPAAFVLSPGGENFETCGGFTRRCMLMMALRKGNGCRRKR